MLVLWRPSCAAYQVSTHEVSHWTTKDRANQFFFVHIFVFRPYHNLFFWSFSGHRPKLCWNDWQKLSHFGQNVWKYRLISTVAAGFDTTVRQMTEKSQGPKCLWAKNDRNVSAKKTQIAMHIMHETGAHVASNFKYTNCNHCPHKYWLSLYPSRYFESACISCHE